MKLKTIYLFITVVLFIFVFTSCGSQQIAFADLILKNGEIITVDENNTIEEAIAIKSDTIFALGKISELRKYISETTEVIDLKGATVIPGFIDSHAHLISTGEAKLKLNFSNTKSWKEVVEIVSKAVANTPPGEWIIGRGWHQEKWESTPKQNVEGFPLHYALSKVAPNNPVLLIHASGHALFTNKLAMDISNITNDTPNPNGGKIIRDSNGDAIGLFMEEAESLIWVKYKEHLAKKSNKQINDDKKKAIHLAIKDCLSNGITSLHDAGSSFKEVEVYKELIDNNDFNLRLYVMLLEDSEALKKSIKESYTIGYGNNKLTVRAIKVYMDGALGSRGAWLLKPYKDMPNQTGLNLTPLSKIKSLVQVALENNLQVCTHAIGDRGNKEILNIYEKAFNQISNPQNLRWRVEHAQHLDITDIPRFNKLGIIAAMQGIHCTSDAPFVEKRLGAERAKTGAYVWHSLQKTGATICSGTDSPVESLNPIKNIYALVTRRLNDNSTFYPEQKMSRLEALKSYTINGAYAAFEENIKGSLEVGKLADMVILSKNILLISDSDILSTRVLYTIIGGKIVYQNNL